jgi:hypothetical protein
LTEKAWNAEDNVEDVINTSSWQTNKEPTGVVRGGRQRSSLLSLIIAMPREEVHLLLS